MKYKEALDRLYYTTTTKYGTGISRRDAYDCLKKAIAVLEMFEQHLDIRPVERYSTSTKRYETEERLIVRPLHMGKCDLRKIKEAFENVRDKKTSS